MEKRTGFLIAIVLTILFCALPGLAMFCASTLATYAYGTDGVNNLTDPLEATILIAMLVCMAVVGLVGVLTPVVIALVMRRQTIQESRKPPVNWNEPIPPPA
jgi:hypothetical protein